MVKILTFTIFVLLAGCTTPGYVDTTLGNGRVQQPANPKGESTQDMEYEREVTTTHKDGTTVTEKVRQVTHSRVGGTYEDAGAKIRAIMDGMKTVQWVGIAMTIFGIPIGIWLAKRGWVVNGILCGIGIAGSGVAMLMLCAFLPQINPYFGLSGLIFVFIACGVWLGYRKGDKDASNPANEGTQ